MADPTVIQCTDACTVTVVLSLPPLQLDEASALQIGGAVLLVWAAGWVIRQLVVLLKDSGADKESSE